MRKAICLMGVYLTLVVGSTIGYENTAEGLCDITAKILVKCMIEPDCDYAVSILGEMLQRVSLSEKDKTLLVNYCFIECNKGKMFRTKQELESALNGEYKAIFNRCLDSRVLKGSVR